MKISHNIDQAVALLTAGGLVAFPTETVYGLGADASNAMAVKRIFALKERPAYHPLIIHLSEINELEKWAENISKDAYRLMEHFSPGPITLILKKRSHVIDEVTSGQPTVGLRIPSHPVALALLKTFGKGMAGPSANKFTRLSPTTALAVDEELGAGLDLILEGGHCEVGLESTIIDMSTSEPKILRPGMISLDQIVEVLGKKVGYANFKTGPFPGGHYLHYSPRTPLLMLKREAIDTWLATEAPNHRPFAVLSHESGSFPSAETSNMVSLPKEPKAYAKAIYHTLRELDHQSLRCIIIEQPPLLAEWHAILDRLTKACGQ